MGNVKFAFSSFITVDTGMLIKPAMRCDTFKMQAKHIIMRMIKTVRLGHPGLASSSTSIPWKVLLSPNVRSFSPSFATFSLSRTTRLSLFDNFLMSSASLSVLGHRVPNTLMSLICRIKWVKQKLTFKDLRYTDFHPVSSIGQCRKDSKKRLSILSAGRCPTGSSVSSIRGPNHGHDCTSFSWQRAQTHQSCRLYLVGRERDGVLTRTLPSSWTERLLLKHSPEARLQKGAPRQFNVRPPTHSTDSRQNDVLMVQLRLFLKRLQISKLDEQYNHHQIRVFQTILACYDATESIPIALQSSIIKACPFTLWQQGEVLILKMRIFATEPDENDRE
ncbi:hypothetical protein CLF_110877 [Clonorchis sinensis]|uniref:Uncharacterized protein n=1 Tax=Clonorchis sinensis TaxID=79923 RepID=G7YL86_CLOSI|nr:hypothetical protein CLF_110877 [Clonorchis sinensis]